MNNINFIKKINNLDFIKSLLKKENDLSCCKNISDTNDENLKQASHSISAYGQGLINVNKKENNTVLKENFYNNLSDEDKKLLEELDQNTKNEVIELAIDKAFEGDKNAIASAILIKNTFKDDKDAIDRFKIIYSTELKPQKNQQQSEIENFNPKISLNTAIRLANKYKTKQECETIKVLLENNATNGYLRNITPKSFIFNPIDLRFVKEYTDVIKDNKDLLENIDVQYLIKNKKNINIIKNIIEEKPDISFKDLQTDLVKRLSEYETVDKILKIKKQTKNFQNYDLKELALHLGSSYYIQNLEEIDLKLDLITDDFIDKKINGKLNDIKKEVNENEKFDTFKMYEDLSKINTYLDMYHTLSGHYNIESQNQESYKAYLENQNPDLKSDFEKAQDGKIDGEYLSDDEMIDYYKESKIDSLREFLKENPKDEIANYLYKEYYLISGGIPKDIQEKCLDIDKKFGTKLFLTADLSLGKEYLDIIDEEFTEWQENSNGKAKFPKILDFSKIKKDYVDPDTCYGKGIAAGFANSKEEYIAINGLSQRNFILTLRHEMTHINDKRPEISEERTNKIMPHIINEDGIEIPDKKICKYKEEFLKAGIPKNHIMYAYNNPQEFIAVASEGDMTAYSDEFKNILEEFGMPQWQQNMKTLHLATKNRADTYKEIIAHLKNERKIDKINNEYETLLQLQSMYEVSKNLAEIVSTERGTEYKPFKIFDYAIENCDSEIINKPNNRWNDIVKIITSE